MGEADCVAIVGESGSGKTTLARCIVGLHEPRTGTIRLFGETLAGRAHKRTLEQRRRIQIVFQNPDASLNPRQSVRDIIARPLRQFRRLGRSELERAVDDLLDQVRLPRALGDRYPVELSGGERQRVSIARALAPQPSLVVCDEITSALDVSVQAAIVNLLSELRAALGLALRFISHDLAVVASLADSIVVMERGVICEQGDVTSILTAPSHPYTQSLIKAVPS